MTTSDYPQSAMPLPRPTRISAPFWRAAREHRLVIQRCPHCAIYLFYPRPFCTNCLAEELEWREVSGRGRVYSFTIVRRASTPAFADKVPYVYAIVELEEGPRLVSSITGCPVDEVKVDMPVRAVFEDASEDIGLVKFTPVR